MEENQEKVIEELKKVLQQWIGRRILVTKEENGDLDQTVIDLERFNEEVYNHTDEYLPKTAVQLIGSGQTLTNDSQAALPYASFDIPIEEALELHCDAEGVFFRTARAVYTLTPI
ncbi:hypothetical protein [Tuberibacillus calidus]|uniref:hypothetical protein n=1 Tax=Tuberibacillus calidus TaxID=340097 RepID=UPI000400A3D0|nr:hypothetical protein [Tuberibacillus calidus]